MIRFHQGDIVIADAEPHSGHEIGGHNSAAGNIRRHFIVVSNDAFNRMTNKAICFPVTSKKNANDPTLIEIVDFDSGTNGSIILRSPVIYDLNSRNAKVIGQVRAKILNILTAVVKDAV